MLPKPKHLSAEYAAQFQDQAIVDAYHNRPPYPPETFDALVDLIQDTPCAVLDVGCGLGDLARPLAERVEWVDAVDWSAGMIAKGQRMPGGQRPNLTWIHARVEDAPLNPPYALITAGDSLHWLDWAVVLPRFREVLSPDGVLAMVHRHWFNPPELMARVGPLIAQYSTNRDYQPYNLVAELTRRGLFQTLGELHIEPSPWRPSIDDYIECTHSTNGFSRERMGEAQAAAFDRAMRAAILDTWREGFIGICDGRLDLTVDAKVIWGRPL